MTAPTPLPDELRSVIKYSKASAVIFGVWKNGTIRALLFGEWEDMGKPTPKEAASAAEYAALVSYDAALRKP
jgi:hypothetical protein